MSTDVHEAGGMLDPDHVRRHTAPRRLQKFLCLSHMIGLCFLRACHYLHSQPWSACNLRFKSSSKGPMI
jgi:hypothetical protein